MAVAANARNRTFIQIPVLVHMAVQETAPVADEAFVREQLEHANIIYRPLGFELVRAGERRIEQAELSTRGDRDALGPYVVRGVLNWFVVARLMDVDEPGRERRGVHWHVRKRPGTHFVVVSAIAGPYVLAHELGHFFGNPSHSAVAGNLMSYQHTDQVPFLDAAQRANVRRRLQAMRSRKELVGLQNAQRFLGSAP